MKKKEIKYQIIDLIEYDKLMDEYLSIFKEFKNGDGENKENRLDFSNLNLMVLMYQSLEQINELNEKSILKNHALFFLDLIDKYRVLNNQREHPKRDIYYSRVKSKQWPVIKISLFLRQSPFFGCVDRKQYFL